MPEQGHLFKKRRNRRKKSTKKLSVRPTPDELETLHARAESFGFKSLSKYLIERGLREGEMIVSADRERIERLLFEVRKLGQNVNQIARRLNGGGRGVSPEQVERALSEVVRLFGEVGEALSS